LWIFISKDEGNEIAKNHEIKENHKDFISPEKEAKMRQHLMGHVSEKSGDVYNQRYIREKANKILLELQTEFQKKVDNYEPEENS